MIEAKFKAGMAGLAVLFGHTIPDDAMKLYWNVLKAVSDVDFERAVRRLVVEFRPTANMPFPVPSHFFEVIGGRTEDRAQKALRKVFYAMRRYDAYSSVDFKDPVLHGVIVRFGGWIKLCSWTDRDWQVNTKAFLQAYSAADRMGDGGPPHLCGIIEHENRGKFPEYVPKPEIVFNDGIGAKELLDADFQINHLSERQVTDGL